MKKPTTTYVCQQCGATSPKWLGKCPSCGNWNTYTEEIVQTNTRFSGGGVSASGRAAIAKPQRISEIATTEATRIDTNNNEFNRVLGGGIVPGSVTLIGGEPGIGKSTLSLQIALNIPQKTLYVSGEESASQIKLRADRLKSSTDNCLILCEVTVENIIPQIRETKPGLVIIDSMTMFYRLNYDNMEMRNDFIRQTEILLDIGRNYDVPVIITSQVYTNITTGSIEFLGGHAMNHNAKTIIRLDMRGNGIRNAVIIKHRSLPEGRSAMFRITADGIRDP